MNMDKDRLILYCAFCGSRELIIESDNVTIQRIKSKTYKDIELEKLKYEERKEQKQEEREKARTVDLILAEKTPTDVVGRG